MRISPAPHIHGSFSVKKIMWIVVIALLPPTAASIYFFGIRALYIESVSIVTAVLTEAITQLLLKRPVTISDGSAVITGLLLALNLPVGVPIYIPIVGSFFAIAIAKQLFGGLGYNIFNPALAGRAFLLFAWPTEMTTWHKPFWWKLASGKVSAYSFGSLKVQGITGATPLGILKIQGYDAVVKSFGSKYALYKSLFIGNTGGSLGETSALAILIGAVILLSLRIISFHIPLSYIATVGIIALLAGEDPLFHILAGGLMLGAWFMATDYVTSPITKKGKIIFGIGCGAFTILFRLLGGLPESVSLSILLMNSLTPVIDRYTQPLPFGYKKRES